MTEDKQQTEERQPSPREIWEALDPRGAVVATYTAGESRDARVAAWVHAVNSGRVDKPVLLAQLGGWPDGYTTRPRP